MCPKIFQEFFFFQKWQVSRKESHDCNNIIRGINFKQTRVVFPSLTNNQSIFSAMYFRSCWTWQVSFLMHHDKYLLFECTFSQIVEYLFGPILHLHEFLKNFLDYKNPSKFVRGPNLTYFGIWEKKFRVYEKNSFLNFRPKWSIFTSFVNWLIRWFHDFRNKLQLSQLDSFSSHRYNLK